MTVYFTCSHCKSELHYDAKRGIEQVNLICPNCKKTTLVNINNNASILDNPGIARAASLGFRLLLKGIFGF